MSGLPLLSAEMPASGNLKPGDYSLDKISFHFFNSKTPFIPVNIPGFIFVVGSNWLNVCPIDSCFSGLVSVNDCNINSNTFFLILQNLRLLQGKD